MPKIFVFLTSLILAQEIFARAGGGGGGHSNSHSGGGFSGGGSSGGGDLGLFELIFVLFQMGPIGWVILIVIAYFAFKFLNAQGAGSSKNEGQMTRKQSIPEVAFLQNENIQEFKNKVATAFILIQKSWSQQRLDLMRRFITDGVYQRFNAQFTMMNLLTQKNPITGIEIQNIQVVKVSREGGYDCVDVAITAVAEDQFVCEKFPNLNSPGGRESFTEYWSFIRREDYKKATDIFHSELCPKCSAALTDKLLETARCPYCGTYINSGEYDWVLSEITQEEDYGFQISKISSPQLSEVLKIYPCFSQYIGEDRATNAFMQILIGIAEKNADTLKRFSTSEAFANFKNLIPTRPLAYNRLYIRAVEILSTEVHQNQIRCYVAVRYAYQSIFLDEKPDEVYELDPLNTDTKVLVMMRFVSDAVAKGSVYANSCASCGAPQKDSLSAVCAYCGVSLNDPNLDWVVEGLTDIKSFRTQALKT